MFNRDTKPNLKHSFRAVIGLLSIGWLSMLAVNLTPDGATQTSILNADGNVYTKYLEITENEEEILDEYKDEWNEADMSFRAMSLANNGLDAFNAGDSENAIELYREALLIGTFDSKNTITLLSNLALAYEAYGDSYNALKIYEGLMNSVKASSDTYYVSAGKTELLSEFIQLDVAVSNFKKALSVSPNNFEANNTLALIYLGEYGNEYKNPKQALAYSKKALKIHPNNTNAKINLAQNYIELAEYDEATQLLNEVLNLRPDSLPVNYMLMKALYLSNQIDDAKVIAEKLTELYDGFAEDQLIVEILN